jgi:hypothetical protein
MSKSSGRGVSAGAAGVLFALAGSASAQQVFNFNNSCATGVWDSSCNPLAGVWRNNWGQTAATQAGLSFPGALDTANIGGALTVDLASGIDVGAINLVSFSTLRWLNGDLSVGNFNNSATVEKTGGRIFSGLLFNNTGASFNHVSPSAPWYFAGTVGVTNSGSISLTNGADTALWSGSVAQKRLINSGTLAVTNPLNNGEASTLSGITLVGNTTGRVRVEGNARLDLPSAVEGTLVGDFAATGLVNIGGMSVVEATTLSLVPASASPWQWISGDVVATTAPLTLAGRLRHAGGRIFSGTLNVQQFGQWTSGGAGTPLYFAGTTTINNQGEFTFEDGADTALWDGNLQQKRFTNAGVLRVTNPADNGEVTNLSGFTLVGLPQGRVLVGADGVLNLGLFVEGTLVGEHSSSGVANIGGLVTVQATTLGLTPNSAGPWRWTAGDIDASVAPLANAGRIEHAGGADLRWHPQQSAGRDVDLGGLWNAPLLPLNHHDQQRSRRDLHARERGRHRAVGRQLAAEAVRQRGHLPRQQPRQQRRSFERLWHHPRRRSAGPVECRVRGDDEHKRFCERRVRG